jgi:hypothetical protein
MRRYSQSKQKERSERLRLQVAPKPRGWRICSSCTRPYLALPPLVSDDRRHKKQCRRHPAAGESAKRCAGSGTGPTVDSRRRQLAESYETCCPAPFRAVKDSARPCLRRFAPTAIHRCCPVGNRRPACDLCSRPFSWRRSSGSARSMRAIFLAQTCSERFAPSGPKRARAGRRSP